MDDDVERMQRDADHATNDASVNLEVFTTFFDCLIFVFLQNVFYITVRFVTLHMLNIYLLIIYIIFHPLILSLHKSWWCSNFYDRDADRSL